MDLYAELAARKKRPQRPTIGRPQALGTPPEYSDHKAKTLSRRTNKMKSQVSPSTTGHVEYESMPKLPTNPTPTTLSSPPPPSAAPEPARSPPRPEPMMASPSSPQRIASVMSAGSSPSKTSSTSSSYEFQPNLTQFHPAHKPTQPLYRPAALRSADHPTPPPLFPGSSTYPSYRPGTSSCKRDHWKVLLPVPNPVAYIAA